MNSIYPEALDGYSQLPLIIDGVTTIDASNINAIRSAIVAIESELGIVPKGDYNNVAARLEAIEDAIEELDSISIVSPMANGLVKSTNSNGTGLTGTSIIVNSDGETNFPAGITVEELSTFNNSIILTSSDGELGLDGGTLRVGTKRYYGASSTAPSSPTPNHGDTYFDTELNSEMYWDDSRNAWLSVESYTFPFGKKNVVNKGVYFNGASEKVMSSYIGEYAIYDGVITDIVLTREPPPSTPWTVTYSVLSNGSIIANLLVYDNAISGYLKANASFNSGEILAVQVSPASANDSTSGTVGKVYYKWRK